MSSDPTTASQPGEAMPKAYDPSSVEDRRYREWEDGGYFKPAEGDGEPFTIIMPPPNLTGELHLGHALMDTVEDILVRWRRMRGQPTLWLPGIDHAAIAVHTLVERDLTAEGLTRYDIGRGRFLERVWDFTNRSRARIFDQHKRLGASADWSRESFTMDPGPARAVRAAFYDLFQKGLIYRGERLINWCPRCGTALSDLEVDHEDEQGHLWHVRYPVIDDAGSETGDWITIATTRPETIVADVAVAVHPQDERYRALVGRKARLPIIGRELAIVADEAIDPAFGTGALKVTPGHDQVDFEIGQRHGLPTVSAIAPDATMNAEAGPYAGLDRFACREAIVRDLDAQGFLVKTEPHTHAVGHCDRCRTIVEPLISEQWFVAVNQEFAPGRSLAGEALQVVRDGHIRFVPERFTKVYTNWMENLRDWCISRQLWWGHRIPVWYCDACDAVTVPPPDVETPERCDGCGGAALRQDEDTLDTWFSSALWPCSTLGWPDDSDDLRRFYPTSVMETGYDLIFFWVARMIMMGLQCMDGLRERMDERIPFRTVYLHGMVRDEHGQKMSKTTGNVIDPVMLIDKYGADALRYSLITGGGTGQDQRLWEEKVESGRNFANKLWNAARFVVMQLEKHGPVDKPTVTDETPDVDRWILGLTHVTIGGIESLQTFERTSTWGEGRWAPGFKGVNQLLNEFQLGEAAQQLHSFVWHSFADWYVEMAKLRLRKGDESSLPVLASVLDIALRMLHPFMPFVTEAIWQRLRPYISWSESSALIVASWPIKEPQMEHVFWSAKEDIDLIRGIVQAIRDSRTPTLPRVVVELAPALKFAESARKDLEQLSPSDEDELGRRLLQSHARAAERARHAIETNAHIITGLTGVEQLEIVEHLSQELQQDEEFLPQNAGLVNVHIRSGGSVDVEAELRRLEREMGETETYLQKLESELANENFRARAPREVIEKKAQRHREARMRLEELRRARSHLR